MLCAQRTRVAWKMPKIAISVICRGRSQRNPIMPREICAPGGRRVKLIAVRQMRRGQAASACRSERN